MHRCPGQDARSWKASDIYDLQCPACGAAVEFWKDEPRRACPGCAIEVRNSRIDVGCAKWCKFSDQCLGKEISKD